MPIKNVESFCYFGWIIGISSGTTQQLGLFVGHQSSRSRSKMSYLSNNSDTLQLKYYSVALADPTYCSKVNFMTIKVELSKEECHSCSRPKFYCCNPFFTSLDCSTAQLQVLLTFSLLVLLSKVFIRFKFQNKQ